jgi:hypothetical protein
LEAGKCVAVTAAPSEFGPVSFQINPLPDGTTQVSIDPPSRRTPEKICLRLRDPRHRRIVAVKTSTACAVSFSDDTIVLRDLKSPADLQVRFGGN